MTSDSSAIVLGPGRADRHYWRDLWHFRELLWYLALRDVRVRYKQSVLGVSWAIIQPAIQTVLLTFVFGRVARMPSGGVPYSLIVLTGLLPWQLFSSAFGGASGSLVSNTGLISKVYFPRMIVPLASLGVALVDLAVILVIALPLVFLLGPAPTWRLLLLPVFICAGLLVAFGAGLWITALTVKYRDFRFITPFLLQVGLFITPIGFRTDMLNTWKNLLALNPLTAVVEGFRWSVLGPQFPVDGRSLVCFALITVGLLACGVWYFRRTERTFADVI